jgi:TPR repeat protein
MRVRLKSFSLFGFAAALLVLTGCVPSECTISGPNFRSCQDVDFKRFAEEGNVEAQYYLGLAFSVGTKFFNQDSNAAAHWFRKASDQGNAKAQYSLGLLYSRGVGVSQNHSEAARWYLEAAEQGHLQSQVNLGTSYKNGLGVQQSYSKTFLWWRKAAEKNFAPAQNNLGTLYEAGLGIDLDYVEAARWYQRAAAQNNKLGQMNFKKLITKLRATENWPPRTSSGQAISKMNILTSDGKRTICGKALVPEPYPAKWESNPEYRNAVDEAILWGFTARQCAEIMGRTYLGR